MFLVWTLSALSVLNTVLLGFTIMRWIRMAHKRDLVLWKNVLRVRYFSITHILVTLVLYALTFHVWLKA
jgi:hypothetical protein